MALTTAEKRRPSKGSDSFPRAVPGHAAPYQFQVEVEMVA